MQTPYDWITIAIFLQRSVAEGGAQDSIISYLPPSLGCAICNYAGNQAIKHDSVILHIIAVLGIAAILAYIYAVLKPFNKFG